MGRYSSWDKKDVVESYHKVDLKNTSQFINNGFASILTSWGLGEDRPNVGWDLNIERGIARFHYVITRPDGSLDKIDYNIPIEPTRCNLGGQRYWFKCQGIKDGCICNKRVRALYLSGDYFVCRHCLGLSYKSKQENFSHDPDIRMIQMLIKHEQELDKIGPVKRAKYRGKPTKKYLRYMNSQNKLLAKG